MAPPPTWNLVTADTTFRGPCMPKDCFGLMGGDKECKDYGGRVYVLRCMPRYENGPFVWYTGYAKTHLLKSRLGEEMTQGGTAADFVKRNKPIQIEFVWPAASPAVEAYIYYALLARLGADAAAAGRLGGWTQTQAHPDNYNKLIIERDRRMLQGSCLGCGTGSPKWHLCRDCQKEPDTCPMTCGHCSAKLQVSSRGFVIATASPPRAVPATSAALPRQLP